MNSKSVIHIADFDFENNQPIKNRYFIILDSDGLNSVVLSVITSQDHVPSELHKHGCVLVEDRNIHTYIFEKGKIVGEEGFSFPKKSFIYVNSNSIRKADVSQLKSKYTEIDIKDILKSDEYENLIYCIYKSKFIARGIKSKLESILQEICS